jgi:hypothetical protein
MLADENLSIALSLDVKNQIVALWKKIDCAVVGLYVLILSRKRGKIFSIV